MAFVVLLFFIIFIQTKAPLLHNICIFITQYCELSVRRNLWLEILEFWACRCYSAYIQRVISFVSAVVQNHKAKKGSFFFQMYSFCLSLRLLLQCNRASFAF